MKKEKIPGFLLIAVAILVLLGFVLGNQYYWFILDIVVIIVCGGVGIRFLTHKSI